MEVTDKIRGFIKDEILFEDGSAMIADDTPLLDGIIDSLALMQVVAFLEEEFGVEIDDGEITADRFRTVAEIGKLVQEKRAVAN